MPDVRVRHAREAGSLGEEEAEEAVSVSAGPFSHEEQAWVQEVWRRKMRSSLFWPGNPHPLSVTTPLALPSAPARIHLRSWRRAHLWEMASTRAARLRRETRPP